jgi:transcription antitermination factor NusG
MSDTTASFGLAPYMTSPGLRSGATVKIKPDASICVHPQTGENLDKPGDVFVAVEVSGEDGFVRGAHHIKAGAMGYFQHEVELANAISGRQAAAIFIDECAPVTESRSVDKGKKFSIGQLITITVNQPHGARLNTGDHCVVKVIGSNDFGVSKIGDSSIWWISGHHAELTDFMPKPEERPFQVGDRVRILADAGLCDKDKPGDILIVEAVDEDGDISVRLDDDGDGDVYLKDEVELVVDGVEPKPAKPTLKAGDKVRIMPGALLVHSDKVGDVLTIVAVDLNEYGFGRGRDSTNKEDVYYRNELELVEEAKPKLKFSVGDAVVVLEPNEEEFKYWDSSSRERSKMAQMIGREFLIERIESGTKMPYLIKGYWFQERCLESFIPF